MRNVVVWNLISLDGYYEGPNQNVMALPLDEAFDAYSAERMEAADTIPSAAAPTRGSGSSGRRSPPTSRKPQRTGRLALSERAAETRRLRHAHPERRRDMGKHNRGRWPPGGSRPHLGAQAGGGWRHPGRGSRTLWNSLLDQGLVDELHLMIGAVVVAAGTPAFQTAAKSSLRLHDLRQMEGSENFVAHYIVNERGSA